MKYLQEIWIYPVKGLGGISVTEAIVEPRGLQYDRRWMLTDTDGVFVSQRELAEMALLRTAIEPPFLVVWDKRDPQQRLRIPLDPDPEQCTPIAAKVWDDIVPALRLGEAYNQWFSAVLGHTLQLIYMPDTSHRALEAGYAPEGHITSFSDGYPFLVIGQRSLDGLNARLANPVSMNRFRPNMVIAGTEPHEEDRWQHFHIGEVPFQGVKPCARCIVTTTDQDTAKRTGEPLRTLSTYRMQGKKILFGQNTIWTGTGQNRIKVGDPVHVILG
jgi:uncharacterized protein